MEKEFRQEKTTKRYSLENYYTSGENKLKYKIFKRKGKAWEATVQKEQPQHQEVKMTLVICHVTADGGEKKKEMLSWILSVKCIMSWNKKEISLLAQCLPKDYG